MPATAWGQPAPPPASTLTSPWADTPEAPSTAALPEGVPTARRWPRRTLPVRPAPDYVWPPGQSLVAPGGRPEDTPDLGVVQHFQMPTARLLRLGDVMGQYVGHLGWVGLRYGLARRVDVGVGVPYYLLGVSVDVRVAFVQSEHFSAAWWGYATVPLSPTGDRPTAYLGFTWDYAGLGWASGPLVTAWTGRVSVSAGLHLAQRTGLGGVWLLAHASADLRVVDGVKLLVQGVALGESRPSRGPAPAPSSETRSRAFCPTVSAGCACTPDASTPTWACSCPCPRRRPCGLTASPPCPGLPCPTSSDRQGR